ncbi:hypothetical protein [Flavobacterium alkalisoli]|uniref:hypothetical protein n=1 Tax=Flavobacterium alkalisoli TaxID=2602769 RepID=UPI00197A7ADE|nr:hypothetical protein [Flavobacterium alkalisoli]
MNDAHFHLIVNHMPIIVPIIGLLVMIGGFISKSEAVKRAAYFIFILAAVCALPAMASGEGAEEIVEHMPGADHHLIHEHEELAETLAMLCYILGGLSLVGLWASFKKKSFGNIVSVIVLVFSVVVIYFGYQTGTSGGEITHEEIRADFKVEEHEHHDHEGHDHEGHDH